MRSCRLARSSIPFRMVGRRRLVRTSSEFVYRRRAQNPAPVATRQSMSDYGMVIATTSAPFVHQLRKR